MTDDDRIASYVYRRRENRFTALVCPTCIDPNLVMRCRDDVFACTGCGTLLRLNSQGKSIKVEVKQ